MRLVIDASIAGAWSFSDEATPAIGQIEDLVLEFGAWVPQLFPLEIANVLLVAERKKRISSAQVDRQIMLLGELSLRLDGETTVRAWHETITLARAERLTVYDATYLELALRLDAVLATQDADLANAARRRGLMVLP